MTVLIIGAGMAGLLAANMLRRHGPVIYERASELPNNHTAVLRFRSGIVGDTLGIPFRKVSIIKDTLAWRNPVADALAYSVKCTGKYRSDRSIAAGRVVAERYIAPPDLIERMAGDFAIQYGIDFNPLMAVDDTPIISTMPMPTLMMMLDYPNMPDMSWRPAVNVRARVKNCDAYVSLNVPDPHIDFSRISLTGDELIVEVPGATAARAGDAAYAAEAASLLGIAADDLYDIEAHASRYAKVNPIDDDVRREFIYWASTEHNIYSLGRFATWRPGLLMDDLVQDVRKIEGWLGGRHYNRRKGA